MSAELKSTLTPEHQRKLAWELQVLNQQMCPCYTGGLERGHRACHTHTWLAPEQIEFVPVPAGGGLQSFDLQPSFPKFSKRNHGRQHFPVPLGERCHIDLRTVYQPEIHCILQGKRKLVMKHESISFSCAVWGGGTKHHTQSL